MIEIKIAERKMKLPTHWGDVTMYQLILLYKYTERLKSDIPLMLSILTCNDESEIGSIDEDQSLLWYWSHLDYDLMMKKILPLAKFAWRENNWDHIELPKTISFENKEIKLPEIEMQSFGQKVIAGQTLRDYKGRIANDLLVRVVAIYLQPIIDNIKFDDDRVDAIKERLLQLPAVEIYPIAAFFLSTLQKLTKEYSDNCTQPLTNEHKRANPQRLNSFGDFAIIHRLSQGNPLNYDAILQLSYREVLTTLAFENQQSLYLARYNDIINRKLKR